MESTLSPMRRGRVLITAKSVAGSPQALKLIEQAGHEVMVKDPPLPFDEQWLIDQAREVDALVLAMEPVTSRLLDAVSRLKVIARPGVGYDTVDLEAASRRGVLVTVASGTNDQSVADFTFGLLLQATRAIAIAADSVRQGRWDRVTGTEAWGKTLAIVGLGRIGKAVAKRARGFDMRVLAVSRNTDDAFAREQGITFVSLEEALREADFVSLHAPLTPDTQDLINTRTLAWFKPGAYLINTSRGGLVDEQALAEAVRGGHLAGAAVDVLKAQGAGSQSPLINVPGIVVTPHMATFTRESMDRVALSVARSVIAVLQGQRPEHIVNPAALEAAGL
ncbi:phosphoglycerate dehydrogenase [Azohydromonas lata]|uniref:Phosphoglycerate dehydrogenase n=1 Tax=Azohydromonas lata TaxID=45677 RepID=A0ABU5ICG1_9BURK|nr:phosphoglycerate dehydrogenase [Azohydromonas lata]MDZ5456797.1 phosphoglycerate dehydrogenase [Azohydromonas lata]